MYLLVEQVSVKSLALSKLQRNCTYNNKIKLFMGDVFVKIGTKTFKK